MCDSKQKSSYEHGSDFERLRSYDRLKLGIYIYIYIYIQGDSGGICNTLGNDSMCDSKQKSSYEHWSDFERLPKYGKKKIWTIL